jgi:hypothetical protein
MNNTAGVVVRPSIASVGSAVNDFIKQGNLYALSYNSLVLST